ncbi:hypothetical protein F4779DRAFT_621267 [Xylariaceae sp. FL0662B]|nr:hypothetical protein F4779DRAFT_621267 [Xylariaceae sp. FL0662B]
MSTIWTLANENQFSLTMLRPKTANRMKTENLIRDVENDTTDNNATDDKLADKEVADKPSGCLVDGIPPGDGKNGNGNGTWAMNRVGDSFGINFIGFIANINFILIATSLSAGLSSVSL